MFLNVLIATSQFKPLSCNIMCKSKVEHRKSFCLTFESELWLECVKKANIQRLQKMNEHGFDVFGYKDEAMNGFCLIHHAVRSSDSNEAAFEMINFICQ